MLMPRYIRKLRIAFSVTCGIACVLLVVLWVRSYWWLDYFHGNVGPTTAHSTPGYLQSRNLFMATRQGRFFIASSPVKTKRLNITIRESLPNDEERAILLQENLGLELNDIQLPWLTRNSVASPYWVPFILTATVAALPWIRWRFSLRTLLIATTLVAVVLGLIIYASR
jgi:hypothetical protein